MDSGRQVENRTDRRWTAIWFVRVGTRIDVNYGIDQLPAAGDRLWLG
jgi:hypothetical protein